MGEKGKSPENQGFLGFHYCYSGTPTGNRTPNLRIKSPLLYQLSYGRTVCLQSQKDCKDKHNVSPCQPFFHDRLLCAAS